jgi:hypothetical protein
MSFEYIIDIQYVQNRRNTECFLEEINRRGGPGLCGEFFNILKNVRGRSNYLFLIQELKTQSLRVF